MKITRPILRLTTGWIFRLAAFAVAMEFANANSTISSSDRHGYAANAGWIDFRPEAGNGVRVDETFLSGYAYAANFGWIHLGDGSPENGHSYSNNSSANYGVNLAADGKLSGFAYSANIGWIAFEQQWGQPTMNYSTGRFSGYTYATNAGWIALDTPSSDLVATSIAAPADTNSNGISDAWEMEHFGNLTTATANSDFDGDGATDLQEYLAGTNPADPSSRFQIIAHYYDLGNNTATLTFTSAPNRRYFIEHDSDLQGPWTDSGFGLLSPDSGESTTRTLAHPSSSKLFFRVQARKPLNP